jgi:hypothetical protein
MVRAVELLTGNHYDMQRAANQRAAFEAAAAAYSNHVARQIQHGAKRANHADAMRAAFNVAMDIAGKAGLPPLT